VKIAVNTRFLLPHKLEGIGWFTHEIFKRLVQQHPQIEWHFLFDRPFEPNFIYGENVKGHVLYPPTRHPLLWQWWFQYSVPQKLKQLKPQLLVSPDGFVPLKSSTPSLAVIHDINFEHQKENTSKLVGWYLRKYFPQYAYAAKRVATVSAYSREDLIKTYRLPAEKCDLVYNGVGDFFKPLAREKQNEIKKSLTAGKPYFIFIGALNPRKNIDGMLEAYQIYRQRGGLAKFVVVGEKMFWNQELDQVYQQHPFKNDIIFTGRLEREELNEVLASAQALAFVSHFEGFGIPILEAFKSEVPVITATNSSMPEVAGNAALLCNSRDKESIAQAFLQTDDAQLRKELIAKGRERGKVFRWDRSAEMMWASIEKTLA